MTNAYSVPNADLNPKVLPCRNCGAEISIEATICPKCGVNQRSRGYKNKVLAGAISLLIGGLGIHRFYLGQWWGIFYILLIWTGIPSLVSLIEAIVFFCADQKKWDFKYNEGRPAGPHEKSGAGVIILVVIAVLFAIVFFLGILAATAIPAYQDYTIRAKASQTLIEARAIREDVSTYVLQYEQLPADNAALGYDTPKLLSSGDAVMVTGEGFEIIFQRPEPQLNEKTMTFVYRNESGAYEWDCTGGSLEMRYRLSECRVQY